MYDIIYCIYIHYVIWWGPILGSELPNSRSAAPSRAPAMTTTLVVPSPASISCGKSTVMGSISHPSVMLYWQLYYINSFNQVYIYIYTHTIYIYIYIVVDMRIYIYTYGWLWFYVYIYIYRWLWKLYHQLYRYFNSRTFFQIDQRKCGFNHQPHRDLMGYIIGFFIYNESRDISQEMATYQHLGEYWASGSCYQRFQRILGNITTRRCNQATK